MPDPAPQDRPLSQPHRKRLRRRETGYTPRFLTFSCYHRLPLLGTPALRWVFVDALQHAHAKGRFQLIAWVVMPEHLHLMIRPLPGVKWAPIAAGLKTSVAKRILKHWKNRRPPAPILARLHDARGDLHFWQPGGGFDRNVRSEAELEKEIRYIHHNPVTRELAARPEDWTWSSARFWIARHERYRDVLSWERSRDDPEPWDGWWSRAEGGLACDWPPGDWRSWAKWTGFV
ncbi:MAG TPA: transposase [Phycisphaerales bacterium]|nr:transposase [Phycisphaerales bacterium]